MHTLTELKRLLEERGLAPRKALGQNFLIDHNLLRKLADASGVGAGDVVLEVGPGAGALTEALLERGCDVVACEIDEGLAGLLAERLGAPEGGRLTLVRGDCMASKHALNPAITDALGGRPFRLVANLPYGVASPLMLTLLMEHAACSGLYVTIQREVADRLMAGPGSRDYGELSVVAQALAEVHRIAAAPPECFWPRPKVTSAMVSLVRRDRARTADARTLDRACRVLFQKRRKQLGAILGRGFALPEGVRAEQRPEELSVEQIDAIARTLATMPRPDSSPA